MSAAADLMFQRGVAGTGVEDVQQAAGVSASQIYHYFGDKQTLVRAVIDHQTDVMLDAQRVVLERLDSFAALREWRDLLVGLQKARHCRGGCTIGSLASELADTDPDARENLAVGFARWESLIGGGLKAMHERGDLRPDADPERLAVTLLAAVQGGLILTQTRRDTAPLEMALDTVLEHIAGFASARQGDLVHS